MESTSIHSTKMKKGARARSRSMWITWMNKHICNIWPASNETNMRYLFNNIRFFGFYSYMYLLRNYI